MPKTTIKVRFLPKPSIQLNEMVSFFQPFQTAFTLQKEAGVKRASPQYIEMTKKEGPKTMKYNTALHI